MTETSAFVTLLSCMNITRLSASPADLNAKVCLLHYVLAIQCGAAVD
jgi:hypothetical protein